MNEVALKILDNPNVDVNLQNKFKNTTLIVACKNKMTNVILAILNKYGTDEKTREYSNQYSAKRSTDEECQICMSDTPCDSLIVHSKEICCHPICYNCYQKLESINCPHCNQKIDYLLHCEE